MTSIIINPHNIKYRESTGKVFFTLNDIQKLPEWPESPSLELIQGELFVVPSPTIRHQRISGQLNELIRAFVKQHQLGEVLYAPIDVIFSEEDVVIPDLVFIANQNASIVAEKNIQGVPDLIVEILSSNKNRDLIEKRRLYEKYQVKEYLVIDPFNQKFLVYHLDTSIMSYTNPKELMGDDILSLTTMKGFQMIVKTLFS